MLGATAASLLFALGAAEVRAQCATAAVTNFSVSQPNEAEQGTVTIGWQFTPAQCCPFLKMHIEGPNFYVDEQIHHPSYSGQRVFSYDVSCIPPGAYNFVGYVGWQSHNCGVQSEDAIAPVTVSPVNTTVMVSLRRLPATGKIEATTTYNFPPGVPRNLSLHLASWKDDQGALHENGPLLATTVAGTAAGVWVEEFDPPSAARWVQVRATAARCSTLSEAFGQVDCPACEAQAGDPVSMLDGTVTYDETDPLPPHMSGGGLRRTYMSSEGAAGVFGRGWVSMFDRMLATTVSAAGEAITMSGDSNDLVTFIGPVGGPYTQASPRSEGNLGRLQYHSSLGVYELRNAGGTMASRFSAGSGRFLGWRDLVSGRLTTITYDASGLPQSVVDSWSGLTWTITTNATTRRVTSISSSGTPAIAWDYTYDAVGNLESVKVNTSPWRTYEYVNNRLTAARDALGNLIESHTYDSSGRGTSSYGPSDEISLIEYLAGANAGETLTRVTTAAGGTTEFVLKSQGTAWRTVSTSGGCSSCGARDSVYAYDREGRVLREQSADGYIADFTYDDGRLATTREHLKPAACDPASDPNRCRLDPSALAEAELEPTGATGLTAYQRGDPLWPDKVTAVTRTSVGMAGQSSTQTYAHHPVTGAMVTTTVCGWTAGASACEERTTQTTLYDGSSSSPAFDPGGTFQSSWLLLPQPEYLAKSLDGPRTDVQDVSSLVYYAVDATVSAMLRGRLAATKNAAGHITRYEAYDVFGNATLIVDPNGVATEMAFDALGRLSTSTVKGVPGCSTAIDPLCATDLITTRTYQPPSGPLARETRAGGGVKAYGYDMRGRLQTISRGPGASDLRERIETSYDVLTGKKSLERKLAFESGSWVEKSRQSFTYDSQSRLQAMTHADSASIVYTYDPEDRLATVQDENHTTPNTTYAYAPAGQVSSVKQALAGAPNGVIMTSYTYDIHGNLAAVTDPNGNVTTYAYDDFGQMRSQVSPVTGTTTYSYDAAGNLKQVTDANGATTVRVYDVLNRVTSATSTLAAATEVVTWTYDHAAAGRFGLGRVASMSDPSGSTEYHYERRGLLRDETRTLTGAQYTYTSGFQYDADGNRVVVKYPSTQLTVTYGFDYAGRPISASGFVSAALYLPFGPPVQLSFANGTSQSMTFDARYRQEGNLLHHSAQLLAGYGYDYDAAGNVTSIEDLVDSGYSRTFEYDDLNRLTVANTGAHLWRDGSYTWDRMGNLLSLKLGEIEKGPTDPLDLSRRHRRNRIRVQENRPLGRSVDFAYDSTTPRLLGLWDPVTAELTRPVTYDAAGNETSFVATRTYSPRNLLAQATDAGEPGEPLQHKIDYTYDGRGIRVARAESPANGPNTTARRFSIYTPELQLMAVTRDDASNVWALSAADKDIHYEIVWFAGRPIAQVTPGGPTLYTFTDHLGTPILQTNATANVIWRAEYEPFGNVYEMREGNRTDQPLRFPGQEVAMNWEGQEENYNIFRWYRSGWGRYTQADPIGVGGVGVQLPDGRRKMFEQRVFEASRSKGGSGSAAMTLYGYADGDPLRRSDPLGLYVDSWECVATAVTPMSMLLPADMSEPQGPKSWKCTYQVKCEAYSPYFGMILQTDGVWQRPMGGINACKCPKYCSFVLAGPAPLSTTIFGFKITLFSPLAFSCGDNPPLSGPSV